jgi:hypothetical protein
MEETRLISSCSFESDEITPASNKRPSRFLKSRFLWLLLALNLLLNILLIIILAIVALTFAEGKADSVTTCTAKQPPPVGDYNQFVPSSKMEHTFF